MGWWSNDWAAGRRIHALAALLLLAVVATAPTVSLAQDGEPDPFAEPEATDVPTGAGEGDNAGTNPDTTPAPAPSPVAGRSGYQANTHGDQHYLPRRTSGFISPLWLPLVVLGLFVWVRTGEWVGRSSVRQNFNYSQWNALALVPFALAFFLMFALPAAAAAPLMLVAAIVPLIVYSVYYNKNVQPHELVFNGEWCRAEWAKVAAQFGAKVEVERKADYEKGAAVDFAAHGAADHVQNNANLVKARQSPGYVLAKELIAGMANTGASQMLLDYRQDVVGVKRLIDGVWHNSEPMPRDDGDVTLAVLKLLANLNPTERRAKQSGEIAALYKKVDYRVDLVSQGVKTGERVSIRLTDPKKKAFTSFADLGMRDKIAEQWAELMNAEAGLVITSAQPGAGVTTLTDVSMMETDRLMRDFFSIEDVHKPERDIENLARHTYDPKQGESPGSILEKLIRLYPNAYLCRDFVDKPSAAALFGEVKDGKLLVTETGASEAVEAPLRLIQSGAAHKDVAKNLTGVINMRLIRKLCDACKVGFEPSPEYLQKLRIPAGKVTTLYRTPTAEEQKEAKQVCEKCGGIGYRGRTGLFELLVVDDTFRETLAKQPKLEPLRKAARAAGMRTHQEEGILLVAKGATSIQELQRVLKG